MRFALLLASLLMTVNFAMADEHGDMGDMTEPAAVPGEAPAEHDTGKKELKKDAKKHMKKKKEHKKK